MSESRWRVGLFGLVLALLCLAARPAYASVADGHISTGENLLELVSKTNASDTRGKTYTLDADVSIDTSTLATSFSRYSPSRTFAGTLDGAGHTITVVVWRLPTTSSRSPCSTWCRASRALLLVVLRSRT